MHGWGLTIYIDSVKGNFPGENYKMPSKILREIPYIERQYKKLKDKYTHLVARFKEKTKALQETERRYQEIVENSVLGIFRSNVTGEIVSVNTALARILKCEMSDLVGQSALELWGDSKERDRLINMLRKKGRVRDFETYLKAQSGEVVPISISARAIIDRTGEIIEMEGIVADITKRKRLEEEVKKYSMKLEEEVRERTQELRKAYEELKEYDRLKTVFLSNVSHELRTPLVTIRGYLEMVLKEQLGKITETQRKYLGVSLKNCNQLSSFIDELLDFSRYETGRAKFELKPFPLEPIIRDCIESIRPQIIQKGISIEYKFPPFIPLVMGDQNKVTQVFTNLLSNAEKFNIQQGKITIEVLPQEEDYLWIRVTDTGIGIPEKHLPKVFDRFYQVDSSTTRRYGGTGIGLAIVKNIIEGHRGTISVNSELNKGTIFTFSLPVTYHELMPEKEEILPHVKVLPAANSNKILFIDDDRELLEFANLFLGASGWNVLTASDGEEGWQIIRKEKPHIIFLDISMPIISGIELCQKIKNDPEFKKIHVYMLTARTTEEDHIAAIKAGADGFIKKPFDSDMLIQIIQGIATKEGN
jgi:PAS domain S-box-containing protein